MEATQPLALKEPRYKVAKVELTGAPPKHVELAFPADHFTYLGGSADLNMDRVRVAFNSPVVFVQLSRVTLVRAPAPVLTSVWVDWDPSEQGKWFQFYYSGAPFIEIGANVVTVAGDTVGLAKEETLRLAKANLDRFQFTSDGLLKVTAVSAEVSNIDVKLSTRASESTLSGIKAQTDKLTFTSDNRLRVDALVSVPPTVTSQNQAYYYATEPSETTENWYNLRIDPAHRLYVVDDQALAKLTQLASVYYAQLIGANETVAQSVTLDTKEKKLLEVYAKADASTTFHLDVSTDNTNWINDVKTYSGVTLATDTLWNGFQYVRLRSDAAGVAGNKVTLILTAK